MRVLSRQLRIRWCDLLVLAATGFFAAGLCFVAPTVFESMDYVQIWKPTFQFLADAVREGRIPLWNPYIGLGRPYLADMQNAVFYPPLYLIWLGQGVGVFSLIWMHCLLAVFGMRRLAGALRAGQWQSYFMAFSFLASGALTARWMTGQILYCCAICYIPWLFECAIRTSERWQYRRIALYAVLLALQFLCGHPQVFWFSAIGQAVFILTQSLTLPLRRAISDVWNGLWQFCAACLWCGGLVSAALLPMLELAKESNRVAASPAFANFFKLEWEYLGSLFSPLGLLPPINWEMNLFVGSAAVVLGLSGLCLVRERNVRGLLGVCIVGMLIALGDNTPFFNLLYEYLPGFASFRIHARAGVMVVLGLICGTGIWLSRPHPFVRAFWADNFALPVRYVVIGLVLFQGLDLLRGTRQIKTAYTFSKVMHYPPDYPFQRTLVARLREAGLMEPLMPPPRVCVPWTLSPPNNGMIYRYSNFDACISLFLQRPWDYLHAVLGIEPPESVNTSVSWRVYSHGPFPYPALALSAGIAPDTGAFLLNTNPTPRAFLVYSAEVVGDHDTILTRLAQRHDIYQCALLEKPLTEPLSQKNVLPGSAVPIRRFDPNSLLLEVEAKQNALLVLAEAWYPGWEAEIDGRVYESVPANGWMRAFPVPGGRHQVRVYFRQNYLLPGIFISLASALLLLFAAAKPKR